MSPLLDPAVAARPAAAFAALEQLKDLVRRWFVLKSELLRLPAAVRQELLASTSSEELVSMLVDWRLLTSFQAHRILAGQKDGLVLGGYRLLDRLGRGGMGSVYHGEHRTLRLPVAVKVLPFRADQDPRLRERFRNEVQTLARLGHPNIVTIIDTGGGVQASDGSVLYFFVMEYLYGQDLEQLVRLGGAPAVGEVCRWGAQLASALAETQRHGIVHRDLKPSNILITHEGHAKLLDFGLVLHRSAAGESPGRILGTVDYMAPEQFDDARRVDSRADLYALGGVLYWALTGRKPFPGEGRDFVDFAQRLCQPPPSPRALRPEVPRVLDLLVRRLLMVRPEDRLDSPSEIAYVLRKYAAG